MSAYYDYYQPEAYIARTDTYIEKDSTLNEEIEKLRLSATRSLFERRDVLIVASVSCIYGLGSPEDYNQTTLRLRGARCISAIRCCGMLTEILYERNDMDFCRGKFRVRGDVLEVYPSYEDLAYRIEFFGDEIERIKQIDPLTGEILSTPTAIDIYPGTALRHLAGAPGSCPRDIEEELGQASRVGGRGQDPGGGPPAPADQLRSGDATRDRHLFRHRELLTPSLRPAARARPWTLLDYFPDDFLLFVDESHVALPRSAACMPGTARVRRSWLTMASGSPRTG